MSSLRLADVTFAWPHQSSLIESCTLDLSAGWSALVGPNGAGKSTLLGLVDGSLAPQSGVVETGGLTIARCHQSPARSADVEEFANAWTADALRWMSLFEIDPEEFWQWEVLSPGERRKWQIAAAVYRDPGILLLDEPTNHLDLEGRTTLARALRAYEGIGLVVSHDRAFLDELCSTTVRVKGGRVRCYPGGYSSARELWLAEELRELERLESAQDAVRQARDVVRAESRRHAAAVGSLSAGSRMSSRRDSDARSTARKERARRAEASIARNRGVARAELSRLETTLDAIARPGASSRPIFVETDPARRSPLLVLDVPTLQAGSRALAHDLRLVLEPTGRIWLTGPNGCGKSTLLRVLRDAWDLAPERLLFLPQTIDEEVARDRFETLDAAARQRALHVGAAILLDVDAVLSGLPLSPGETRKLALAVGFAAEPWLLVLDEPTNDLDVEAIERLEAALADYPGALLMVTHDLRVAEAIGAERVEFVSLVGKG